MELSGFRSNRSNSLLNPCPANSSGEVKNNFSAIRVQHDQSCIDAIA